MLLQGFRKWHRKWAFFAHSMAELTAACTYSPLVMEKKPNIDVLSYDMAIFALVLTSAAFGTISSSQGFKKQNAATKHHLLTIAGSILQFTLVMGVRANPERRTNFVACAYAIAFLLNQTNTEAFKAQSIKNKAKRNNEPERPTPSESDNEQPGFFSGHVFNINCILSFNIALLFIISLSIKNLHEATKVLWINVGLLNVIILNSLCRLFSMTFLNNTSTAHEFRISHINTAGFATTLLIPTLLVLEKDPTALYQSMSYFVGQTIALLAQNFANMIQYDKSLLEAQKKRETARQTGSAARTEPTTLSTPRFFATSPTTSTMCVPQAAHIPDTNQGAQETAIPNF